MLVLRLFALMTRGLVRNQNARLISNTHSRPPEPPSGQSEVPGQYPVALSEGWGMAAVLLLTAILYFVSLGTRALWASEFRWAEIAREMLLTHHYFWPTINGRVYFDKPLGSYWLVLVSTLITGRMDEAATRIPAAAAGVLSTALLILLARRLYDLRTGTIAGFILATSFSFAFWARTASADIETVAGELAALLIFANNRNRDGWWVVAMWLLMAVTSMMKGLLGFVLPTLVIGFYCCVVDGWSELRRHLMYGPLASRIHWLIEQNRWFFNRRTIVAVGLAGALYFAPFVISSAITGSSKGIYMVYRENVERYFAPFDHRGPIYLYAFAIFELMAPWSVFLPAGLVYAHSRAGQVRRSTLTLNTAGQASQAKEWDKDLEPVEGLPASDTFVLVFFWTIFVFFTLSGSRRSYYILPILPAASILVARIFVVSERSLSAAVRWLLKLGFGLTVSVLVLSIVALLPARLLLPPPYAFFPSLPRRWIFAGCWVIGISSVAYACVGYSRRRILFSVGLATYLLLSYVFILAIPAGDQWRGEKRFADMTRHLIDGHPDELASFKVQPPVFYLGLLKPVPEYDTLRELASAIRLGQVRWVIVRRRDVSRLTLPASEATFEASYPWDSREHRGNALVLMRLEP